MTSKHLQEIAALVGRHSCAEPLNESAIVLARHYGAAIVYAYGSDSDDFCVIDGCAHETLSGLDVESWRFWLDSHGILPMDRDGFFTIELGDRVSPDDLKNLIERYDSSAQIEVVWNDAATSKGWEVLTKDSCVFFPVSDEGSVCGHGAVIQLGESNE